MSAPWLRLVRATAALAIAAGCAGKSLDSEPDGSCRTDSDCSAGQVCAGETSSSRRSAKGYDPCGQFQRCESAADCNTGQVCAPGWQIAGIGSGCNAFICGPPCIETGCTDDSSCSLASGLCELTRCDADGAAACPERWRCDSVAAEAETPNYAGGSTDPDAPDAQRAISRGCVRKRCDESGGFRCRATWQCLPAGAEDGSGCVPLDCAATGRCEDDQLWICAAASATPRPDGAVNANGCVLRNCAEGGTPCELLTTDHGRSILSCQPGAPLADSYSGCVFLPCQDSYDCFGEALCDPGSPAADERGCRLPNATTGAGGSGVIPGTPGGSAGSPPAATGGSGGSASAPPNEFGRCVAP